MTIRTTITGVALCGALAVSFLAARAAQEAPQLADLAGNSRQPNRMWLDELDLSGVEQEWGAPGKAQTVDGKPLTIGGKKFLRGIGTHASSTFVVDLKGAATRFAAVVGLDDEQGGKGSASFEVWVDGKKAADTGTLKAGGQGKLLSVDLTGAQRLMLVVTDGGDGINDDHADWAGAMLLLKPGATERPVAFVLPPQPPPVVAAPTDDPKPAIHGPRVVGTTPGNPFLHLIPATGEKPLRYGASGLPDGITLDPTSGILSGSATTAGTSVVTLAVSGPQGTATRKLVIVAGKDKLALTPPLGWNSWNVWAGAVDDAKVRAAGDQFISSGLAAHGYSYVNIDDCWQGKRDARGVLQPNSKFPNMKATADYLHARGLKMGIYSSPGPKTCAGFEGSYQHEAQDAKTWAGWGVDYLKHDWCSYGDVATGDGLERQIKPYRTMRTALDKAPRDIVYSLCQYGMGDVWTWGDRPDVRANLWRTTGDIVDTWNSMATIGFSHDNRSPSARPGGWNDPDMLVVGRVGWGPNLHPTRLNPHEQLTHMSLWSLLASPLLIGCDLTQLDNFTKSLLLNDEVLDINQDPLGKAAVRVQKNGQTEVWARPLFDGTQAVGLFNRGREPMDVNVAMADLKVGGRQPVRDLWQRKDLGTQSELRFTVPAHGVILVKVGKPTRTEYTP